MNEAAAEMGDFQARLRPAEHQLLRSHPYVGRGGTLQVDEAMA
jgi:hypothetical protein